MYRFSSRLIKPPDGRSGRRDGLRACAIVALSLSVVPAATGTDAHPLMGLLSDELATSMEHLESADGTRPYFLQYTVTDKTQEVISATLGATDFRTTDHSRLLDVDVRCGDYTLDNTHQIRGQGGGSHDRGARPADLPLDGDMTATRHAVWLTTDRRFRSAARRLAQVRANVKVKVEEEDEADDFSRESPHTSIEPWLVQSIDRSMWQERIRASSARMRAHPLIYQGKVSLSGVVTNRVLVSSEGSRIQTARGWWRIGIHASTIAEDGMELWQYHSFDAHAPDGLPSVADLEAAVDTVVADVLALRAAPVVDPYTGPAILRNRATGVFFHEIFGHRIEGHRQKDVDEGQTFAKKIDQPVLPGFLSVIDDPTQRVHGPVNLNGYYKFDAECMPAQPVNLVEEGILKTFLLSRSPTRGFTRSNGHGRREPGRRVVARQGNLIINSARQTSFDALRERLIAEARVQGKEYGLLFEDISGGFTTTQRYGPQAFKVLPIIVKRVYVDGRPDELVRGVDIVGTPLTCFAEIIATGDDPAVFNGVCGAESGSVPVSAIAPSVLVRTIEIEKKRKAQDRPPILPSPLTLEERGS